MIIEKHVKMILSASLKQFNFLFFHTLYNILYHMILKKAYHVDL